MARPGLPRRGLVGPGEVWRGPIAPWQRLASHGMPGTGVAWSGEVGPAGVRQAIQEDFDALRSRWERKQGNVIHVDFSRSLPRGHVRCCCGEHRGAVLTVAEFREVHPA